MIDTAPAEPGWTTTEFAASVIAVAVLLVKPFGLAVTPDLQGELITLVVSVYTLARGIRKHGTPR